VNRNRAASALLAVGLLLTTQPGRAVEVTAPALTLDDYFAASLKRSEVVATQTELIRQAEERARQASSALLPTVNGVATYTWQEPVPSGTAITSTSQLDRQSLAKLTATQPLFRGFREFAALRQTRSLLDAQNDDYRQARVQLFRDVVQNFYSVLSSEQDIANLDEEIHQNGVREQDIRERVRIGRSRASELLNVQSTISTLRAQREQLQGQLSVERETLAFLSGLDAATPLRDSEVLPAQLEPLEDYLARVDLRPDVQAGKKRLAAGQENVAVARGAHLPSLDLNGNYYLDRPGNLKDITWDVQLALSVPIFAGGSLQSKVREAQSQSTQAELNLEQVRRQAQQEIRALYQSVQFDRSQLEALEKATESARKNYAAQTREYRLGLVTNLDVNQALTAYLENQRATDRVRYVMKLDYLKLQAAAQRRPGLPGETAP
jgi:outer membrane protein